MTDPVRVNDSLLAGVERRFLDRLAAIVAPHVTADACSLAGLSGAVLCCAGYALSNWAPACMLVAVAGVALHWLGDALDGTVARLRRESRPRYGFYVDHFLDTISQMLLFVGVGLSPVASLSTAALTLASLQALNILVLLRTVVFGEFRLSFGRLGPTEAHVGLVVLGVAGFLTGPVTIKGISVYDSALAIAAVFLCAQTLVIGVGESRRLRRSPA
ncbi:CDP-alcohol phosphatidyltransferase family protein [Catenuloplanes japonicus]|uniref:CDP-alcohol phosphatidyltransferase family protein n=1 Tax=Catenuloplanes japonicus TaxID=33876 RepID=UPI0005270C81|nr:CDP-alcohol phosphatidyltransferase family protein [Catenuloplanes japonicus]